MKNEHLKRWAQGIRSDSTPNKSSGFQASLASRHLGCGILAGRLLGNHPNDISLPVGHIEYTDLLKLYPNIKQLTVVAHIDLCATILELAGAEVPNFVDGKSFKPILDDPASTNERTWRKPVIIENWQSKRNRGKVFAGSLQWPSLLRQRLTS